jgi:hypothetical protein
MYQDAAEQDPSVSIPADPDWHLWANDVRLMRAIDGRTHKQICELYKRVNQDAFWKHQALPNFVRWPSAETCG